MKNAIRVITFVAALFSLGYAWWTQPPADPSTPPQLSIGSSDSVGSTEADSESIRVATFNVQVFGIKKLEKPKTIATLARIIRRFDVVAVQEIRSADQSLLERFIKLVNSNGSEYDYVLGPRLGRTVSMEQYAYVYNTARIEVIPGSVYTIRDPDDLLHREPLVARFRVRGLPPEQAATFTLINIHTDPEEVQQEINVLDNVIATVRRDGSGEDDVILLGDLNADERRYGDLLRVPNLRWAVQSVATNTRQTKAYDNILFDATRTREFTGRAGVLNLMTEYKLSRDQALEISDHMPVWAEFRMREATADGGSETTRYQ